MIVFLFGILNFGHWNLFVFWDLLFEISANSIISRTDTNEPLYLFLFICQPQIIKAGDV